MTIRFLPCPAYDMARLESWLEDLAAQGLHLKDKCIFLDAFEFTPGPPQKVHYRLEVITKPQSFWSGDPSRPQPEALALHEEFGWEFVLRYREFYLYRSAQADPRELHTEAEVQDMTYRMLKKQLRGGLFSAALMLLLQGCFGLFALPLAITATLGEPLTLVVYICILGLLLFPLESMYHLGQMRRLGIRRFKTDWRKGANAHRLRQILGLVLAIWMFFGLGAAALRSKMDTPLSQVTGPVPFVTLDDLADMDEDFHMERLIDGSFTRNSTLLFPEVWEWTDGGHVDYDGDQEYEVAGILSIQYFEARTPWLARGIARDMLRFYQRQNKLWKSGGELLPLDYPGLDDAIGYCNEFGLVRVVLVKDNITVCGRCSMSDIRGHFTMEAWADAMARKLWEEHP